MIRHSLLDDVDSVQAQLLKERFALSWLALVEFEGHPAVAEAAACLALWVELDPSASRSLRATNYYTGSTYWLHEWNGDQEAAEGFMDEVAAAAAEEVRREPHNRGRRSLRWELDRPPTLQEIRGEPRRLASGTADPRRRGGPGDAFLPAGWLRRSPVEAASLPLGIRLAQLWRTDGVHVTDGSRYDPQDSRTLPQHPMLIGRAVEAWLPDGTILEPGPDGLFPRALPLLTRVVVKDAPARGKEVTVWRLGPEGLSDGMGHLTPEDAATDADVYPPAARAQARAVEYLSDEEAIVTVDTVPSFPLRCFCYLDRGLWVYDPRRSEHAES